MEEVRLSKIAQISAGQAAPKEFSDFGLPFIRAGHLEELIDGKKLNELPKVNDDIAKKNKLKVIPAGSILFAKSGMSATKNRIFITTENSYYVSHLAAVIPSPKYDSSYLARFLSWYNPTNLILDNAYPSIRLEDINNLEITLPNLANQQRIAAILDQADAIIQNNRAIVQKYDALTQSLFLDMFGDPVKNEKGWEVDNLSIVAPFKKFDGKIKKINGNYWLLNLDMIEQQTGNVIEKKYVSANEINTSTISFSENQVLYSKLRPYLNKVLIPDESGYGTSELVPMNPKGGVIDKFFLAHLLRTNNFVNYINDKVAGAKMPRVNMDTLRDFQIILPPIQLQNQFAERVAMIEAQKEQAQIELAKSEELFQSLLQRAFKGELN